MKPAVALIALLAASCGEPGHDAQRLGGALVDGAILDRGRTVYTRYCVRCHGDSGDGNGPAATAMWPPPRNFQSARFKFAGIEDRGLPHDEELVRIVTGGLHGSAMLDWDLPADDARAVIQYIKTFSPPGRGFRNPRLAVMRPTIPADPLAGDADAATLARGSRLYHSLFQCAQCHPAYVDRQQFAAWGVPPPRTDAPELPVPKWSDGYQTVLLPPDFRRHRLRSVRLGPGGASAADLYRVIAYGLQGPMPAYGHLDQSDIWAVVHYTKRLVDGDPR